MERGNHLIAMSSAGSYGQRHTTKKKKLLNIVAASSTICMSIDGFSEVNSQPCFNIMAGYPLPPVIHTFRLEGRQETSDNPDVEVSKASTEASDVLQKKGSRSVWTL